MRRSVRFVAGSVAAAALAASALVGVAGNAVAAGAAPKGAPVAQADAQASPDGVLLDPGQGSRLQNVNSGKCLVVQGYNNNSQAFQFDCAGFDDQYWVFDKVYGKNNAFRIRNFHSGKCLVARGVDGESPVVTTDCADYDDQLWWAVSLQMGGYQLKSFYSLRCMIVRGGQPGNGAVVGGCDKNFADQRWTW
ncbi:RICIN domain-containing protein [Kitasatospora purpeofusca]|uniref:RICIN domain-containing protein n=1 Tax=Kitasatospora purpeofusca TaxID=67352 RepID=UPI0036D22C9B